MAKILLHPLLLTICIDFLNLCSLNAQTNGWLLDYQPGLFSEFLIDSNGCPILFPANPIGPVLRKGQDGKWDKMEFFTERTIYDVVSTGQNAWLLIEQGGTVGPGGGCAGMKIYEFNGSSFKLKVQSACPYDSPLLNVDENGAYVISEQGGRFILNNTQHARSHYCHRARLLSVNLPGYGLWFWSHIEYAALNCDCFEKYPSKLFLVCKSNRWHSAACPSSKLGGMVLISSNTVVCGAPYKGFFSVKVNSPDPDYAGQLSTTVQMLPWHVPTNEQCIFLHYQPSGLYIIISASAVDGENRVPAKNGYLGSLTIIENNQERVILSGVDFGPVRHDKGRPVVDTPVGAFIARGHSGLMFVSTNPIVCWQSDWRHGFPLPNIDRMRVKDDKLYLLDRKRGFVIADWHKMINCPLTQKDKDWKEYISASNPMLSEDGTMWFLTADAPPTLRHLNGEQMEDVAIENSFKANQPPYQLAEDSAYRIWIDSGCVTGQVAVSDQNKIISYASRDEAYVDYTVKERKHFNYRIQNPFLHYTPVFSGDGRVAYYTKTGIRYFSDMSWSEYNTSNSFGGKLLSYPPYFEKGALSVYAGDSLYQLKNGRWIESPKKMYKRKKNINYLNWGADILLPDSFPGGKTNCPIKLRDNIGTLWAGSQDKLYRGVGDYWMPFDTAETPLIMAETISSVIIDGSGGIWFETGGWDYKRLAYYYHSDPTLKLEWAKPPLKKTTTGDIEFYVQSSPFDNPIIFQYDNNQWKQIKSDSRIRQISFEYLRNGQHTLCVRVFNKQLNYFTTLAHTFKVDADYVAKSRNLILQLKADNFEQRENAARQLVAIGDTALAELRHAKAINNDHAWWIKAVSDQILRDQSIDQ